MKKREISYVNEDSSFFTIILQHLSDFHGRYAEITSYAQTYFSLKHEHKIFQT